MSRNRNVEKVREEGMLGSTGHSQARYESGGKSGVARGWLTDGGEQRRADFPPGRRWDNESRKRWDLSIPATTISQAQKADKGERQSDNQALSAEFIPSG